jgi:hypothetical protein
LVLRMFDSDLDLATSQNTLKALLPEHFTNAQCLKVAKALMHTKPQLFVPIPYSEKSLLKNTVYDSPDEIYTFDEDVGDEEYPHGVYTPLTPCYVRGCVRADGGCYAPRCPNRPPRRDVPVVMNVGELQEVCGYIYIYIDMHINVFWPD